jgi:hypothetical protein
MKKVKNSIKRNRSEVIFEYSSGINPISGYTVFSEATNGEVFDYCGKFWQDLSNEEKEHVIYAFNNIN